MDKSYEQYLIDIYQNNRSISKKHNYHNYQDITGKSILDINDNKTDDMDNMNNNILNFMRNLNKKNNNYLKDII